MLESKMNAIIVVIFEQIKLQLTFPEHIYRSLVINNITLINLE